MTRLLTAAVLIPSAWYLCKRAPVPLFLAACLILAGIAAWECADIFRRRGSKPFSWLALAFCVAVVWSFAGRAPRLDPMAVLAAAVLSAPAIAMLLRATPEEMLDSTTSTLFPVLLVGIPWAYVVGLHAIPEGDGPDLLLLAMLCVTLSDTGAYYVGSAIGTHRMAPVISPRKTWEGMAGGVFGSVVGALLAHVWFFRRLSLLHALTLGVVLCTAGILGDLAESMIKRSAGVKDSSALLPGHGGVFDRIDSLLVAAPVLYYYWKAFLAG